MIKPIYIVVGGLTAVAVVLLSTLIPATKPTEAPRKEVKPATPTPEPSPVPKAKETTSTPSPVSSTPAPKPSTLNPSSSKTQTERLKSNYESLAEGTSDDGDWYDVISTGRLIETKKEHSRVGDWGTRNRALAHMNSVVVGRKLGIV